MKKLYIVTLCAAVCLSAAGAGNRFVSKRDAVKSKIEMRKAERKAARKAAKAAGADAIMRPGSYTEHMHNGEDWEEMATIYCKYDNCGNLIEESYTFDDIATVTVMTYDDNNMLTSKITYEDDEPMDKMTYKYDPIIKDFYVERMGYDYDGEDWAENFYCVKNEITRDADGNITEMMRSMPMDGEFIPAYKSVWKYDPTTKQATEFAYYAYNTEGAEPTWELYEGLLYKDIEWQKTDGQLVSENMAELVEGDNLLKKCAVYFDDELDGYITVDYINENTGDYFLRNTLNDETVGSSRQVETIDANGSKRTIDSEYFDDQYNFYADPVYQGKVETIKDDHGNVVLEAMYEAVDGGEFELMDAVKYDITYDADGNITEHVESYYDADADDYMPSSKIVYGDYDDVSAGIGSIIADDNAPAEYYNLQGIKVANPESGLYIRRQGKTVTKVIVK